MKIKKSVAILVCCLMFGFILVGCTQKNKNPENSIEPEKPVEIKNVIMMIGDGFGPNHLTNAKNYFEIDQFAYEADYICDVTTYSKDCDVTDSAASASALATGKKHNNGEVSRHQGNDTQSIIEIARAQGKKTGIMTSDALNGATPAAYSAHTKSREEKSYIIEDQIKSGIDILVGSNSDAYSDAKQNFIDQGYNYIDTAEDFESLDSDQKYIANLSSYLYEWNQYNLNYPSLITKVLNYLDNENGFFLMIENGFIDGYSHNKNFLGAMDEVKYYAAMIDAVYAFCADRDDTVVIITSDHETGGLTLPEEGTKLNEWDIEKLNGLYTTESHTSTNVKLFIRFTTPQVVRNYKDVIDNTDIFTICQRLVMDGNFDFSIIEDSIA